MYIDPYEIFLQGQSYNWKLKKKEILVYVESTPHPPNTHTPNSKEVVSSPRTLQTTPWALDDQVFYSHCKNMGRC